jgi:hypothetical protein
MQHYTYAIEREQGDADMSDKFVTSAMAWCMATLLVLAWVALAQVPGELVSALAALSTMLCAPLVLAAGRALRPARVRSREARWH